MFYRTHNFLKKFIARSLYTACTGTNYKVVSLNNLNKYLHSDTSDMEVNINVSANDGSEKL